MLVASVLLTEALSDIPTMVASLKYVECRPE
jgi:hypothetical protein